MKMTHLCLLLIWVSIASCSPGREPDKNFTTLLRIQSQLAARYDEHLDWHVVNIILDRTLQLKPLKEHAVLQEAEANAEGEAGDSWIADRRNVRQQLKDVSEQHKIPENEFELGIYDIDPPFETWTTVSKFPFSAEGPHLIVNAAVMVFHEKKLICILQVPESSGELTSSPSQE
jgi:hypothetical protein